MKLIYSIVAFILACLQVHAQNVVANCSFEQYTTCPTAFDQVANSTGWDGFHTGTTDYYNTCHAGTICGVPTNTGGFGYQQPAHGNAYMGAYTVVIAGDYKEYIHRTIPALQAGMRYEVSVSVSLANQSYCGTDDIGVLFYIQKPYAAGNTVIQRPPQIDYSSYGPITDTQNWVRLTGTFVADSAYTHVVMGGFKPFALTTKQFIVSSNIALAYYLFDSLVVRPLKINTALADSVFCQSGQISVPYTVTNPTPFSTGNTFTLQLSGPTGNFAAPYNLGTVSSTTSGTITGTLPAGLPPGVNYRVRIFSSNPVDTSLPDPVTIDVKPRPVPVATGNSPVCEGSTLSFSATTLPGSSYIWTGPGSFGSNQQSNNIVNATPAHSGDYIVTATLNGCSGKDTISLLVKPMPAVPTANNNGPICEGSTLNLNSASATAGVSYNWAGPGGFNSIQQNPSITNATVTNSGIYNVTASLNGCTTAAGTTTATVKLMPAVPVAGNNTPICTGTDLLLTANSTPGVVYNWTGPGGFTSTQQNPAKPAATLADTGDYSVSATLNGCTSAPATTHVTINLVSTIGGWVSPNDTICEGTVATFVVVPTNAGPSPTFQWFKNSTAIAGATTTVLVTSDINTGDSFYCQMMAPNVCPTLLTVYSNGIKMHKLPITLTPSVAISSNPAQPMPGQPVNFLATVVNGGYQPQYQWQRNGQDVFGAIHANWSANNLAPYDKINCKVTSSDPCATPKAANSDTIIINFPTAVNDINNNNLRIYPNPVQDELIVDGVAAGTVIELLDVVGRKLYRTTAGEETLHINTSGLAKGNYLLQLYNSEGRKVVKVMKE